ncbi:MAG: hypothetical protein ACRCVS_01515 [Fusobacteriaceae bacterium]
MSPKDKVRANIYKNLLQEEKTRSKRYLKASFSLFLVGVISSTSYHTFIKSSVEKINPSIMVFNKDKMSNDSDKIEIDHFFTKDIFKSEKIEINTDQVFGFDFQS